MESKVGEITVTSALHVDLNYYILSHLNLLNDAANIYSNERPLKSWVEPLYNAYMKASHPLLLQVLALYSSDLNEMLDFLKGTKPTSLPNNADNHLRNVFITAMESELPAVKDKWSNSRFEFTSMQLLEQLQLLRNYLCEHFQVVLPRLKIIHCPFLSHSRGTYGRGAVLNSGNIIAVSLTAPEDKALCQIFHEEIHTITDLSIRTKNNNIKQNTNPASKSFFLHQRLEKAAIDTGTIIISKYYPQLLPAYKSWQRSMVLHKE